MKSIPRPTLMLGCLLALYLLFASFLIPRGIDDIQMAAVYSADESGAAAEVSYYHRTGRLSKASFTYGSLFYSRPAPTVLDPLLPGHGGSTIRSFGSTWVCP